MALTLEKQPAHAVAAWPPQPAAEILQDPSLIHQFRDLQDALQQPVTCERRSYARIPLPLLLQVTPLDQTEQRLDNSARTVIGKDISPQGLSFFHDGPIPYRKAMVTFDHPELGRFTMEVDIGWCRFTDSGWYISGARLLRTGARNGSADSAQEA